MNEGGRPQPFVSAAWRVLVGRPLRSSELAKEQITPVEGLSALSLDALTSVAYGPEAILVVLAAAGSSALHLVLPLTAAIVVLLAILVLSYRQVIDAYPGGGGAYAVARANLGGGVAQVAAASLIVDYTLTASVSIAAGVGQFTSAFPSLSSATLPLCVGMLALITVLNLRGLGDTARAFLLPTAIFIVGLLAVIAVGLVHPLGPHPLPSPRKAAGTALEAVGVLLVLKAFAAGCSALTGVEAIANGVPLFRQPRRQRAKRTEVLLGVILAVMLLGLGILAKRYHVRPRSHDTVLSQIMGASVGRHWAYYVVSLAITAALALAANTSFGGLPILTSLLARDNHLPHLFSLRGDRQMYSNGIVALAAFAAALLLAVNGNTQRLIPMFAIGVFTSFTLCQSGLVVHWWRQRPSGWQRRAAVNGLGAVVTAASTVVFLVTKFTAGGWVVVVVVAGLLVLFRRIQRYYRRVAVRIGLDTVPPAPHARPSKVIVPITNVSLLSATALSEAMSLSHDVLAVTVVLVGEGGPDQEDDPADAVRRGWARWNPGVPLKVLRTEYASVVEPIVELIDHERAEHDAQIVVLIPYAVPHRLWHRILHNHLDFVLSNALRSRTDLVVARVPIAIDGADAPGAVDARMEGERGGGR